MHYHETQICQHQAARLLDRDYKLTRENILGDGLKLCRRSKWFHSTDAENARIDVHQREDGRYSATMRDVAHCGNAHLCPFCASTKAAHLRDWITQVLIPAIQRKKLHLGLMTLTARHKRESDWSAFVKAYYAALADFRIALLRDLKRIGSVGRVRAVETPVGGNGIHLHVHDLFTYAPGADLDALCATVSKKWKAALKKHGLQCGKYGTDIKAEGGFEPIYIAKEITATDAKTESKSDLRTLFFLLSRSARGDKQAGADWIRAARAIQGLDRWNVGQLAAKLGIPCPSDWQPPAQVSKEPIRVITYPQAHHMHATSPSNPRPALAHIFNAAIRETRNPETAGRTADMALRMCAETITADIEELKHKHAHKLAKQIQATGAPTDEERQRLAARQLLCWMQDVVDYKRATHARLFPAPQMLPLPPLWGSAPEIPATPPSVMLEFGQELEFT
jgi:hypothetical protein